MMKQLILAVFLGGMVGVACAEEAPHPHPRRNQVARREHRQHKRIQQGVKSGELTREEAKGLRTEQRAIRQERREMMKDGHLTKDEHKELNQDLNKASQDIYQEKHDTEKR